MKKIELHDITKTLDGIFTLDRLSLQVAEGEFVVLIGPSGCGKSTLFHVIAGLILPDRGTVYIDGQDFTGKTGRVGYMQQKDLLLPFRSIIDNVSIPLLLKGIAPQEARRQASSLLQDFGLDGFANHYPRQLSGGMRQRAALLRTYLQASDILLLDEPFASLDAINRHKMQLWLKNLRTTFSSSVLFVTHDIQESLLLADRIYVLSARPARVRLEIDLHNRTLTREETDELKLEILSILEADADN